MIRGILFDKDGTLVEFNSQWVKTTQSLVHSIVNEHFHGDIDKKRQEIEKLIGLDGDKVNEHGLLAGYTTKDLSIAIANALNLDEDMLYQQINEFYFKQLLNNPIDIKPLGDLQKLFARINENQIKIGIVTADDYNITKLTIETLGIGQYVDFIATADRYKKKPDNEALLAFCNQFQLQQNEVIHVGDTEVDMKFSKHCLLGIGVLSGVGTKKTLSKYTPYIIESVDEIPNLPFLKIH